MKRMTKETEKILDMLNRRIKMMVAELRDQKNRWKAATPEEQSFMNLETPIKLKARKDEAVAIRDLIMNGEKFW
jgi:hypothetical protein